MEPINPTSSHNENGAIPSTGANEEKISNAIQQKYNADISKMKIFSNEKINGAARSTAMALVNCSATSAEVNNISESVQGIISTLLTKVCDLLSKAILKLSASNSKGAALTSKGLQWLKEKIQTVLLPKDSAFRKYVLPALGVAAATALAALPSGWIGLCVAVAIAFLPKIIECIKSKKASEDAAPAVNSI